MTRLFFVLLTLAVFMNNSSAQWSTNPYVNNPICSATNNQYSPAIVSDGSGGAILTWTDLRNGTNYDIYAQWINSSGAVQWTADGAAISTAANNQSFPAITGDGSGGAIIVWQDYRNLSNYDIYAQLINTSGVVQWATDGVAICTTGNNQNNHIIASDGSGGAIIVWEDYRNSASESKIYAQRINQSGVVNWPANGVAICTAAGSQLSPRFIGDGSGGCIITWDDYRNGNSNSDIYAQRIDSSGVVQWTTDGIAISAAVNHQSATAIMSDSSGGAIIVWHDFRNGSNYDIFAQRINASGVTQWTSTGIVISTAANDQTSSTIVGDGSGGAIIAWRDLRNGNSNSDIYAQRINASGVAQWTVNGVPISAEVNNQTNSTIVGDGSGGAVITWQDFRSGNNNDIYAQRIDASGVGVWTTNGVAICLAIDNQYPGIVISDGSGGAIMSWQDNRNSIFNTDIYVQNIDNRGNFGVNPLTISTISDVLPDQGGKVRVTWQKSTADASIANLQIVSYGLWRKIPASLAVQKTVYAPRAIMNDTLGTLYDFIVSLPAVQSPYYHVVAPTLEDSSESGTHKMYFLVTAHTGNPNNFYISNIDSGYSVDNLSPVAVTSLVAQPVSGPVVNLHWNKNTHDPDVRIYVVHRSTTNGFTPGPGTKIGETSDTSFVDGASVSGAINYYRVVTVDIHDNQSIPSPQASAVLSVTQQIAVNNKWNMLSVPMTVTDYTKTILYPSSTSNAYKYASGYQAQSTLQNGTGYWLKFSGNQIVDMTGFLRNEDTIDVVKNWNMIGSISETVSTATITSIPGGMVTSQFYGYDGAYFVSTSIEPGKAYWVKVNQNGQLILSSSSAMPKSKIRISTQHEIPPGAPDGDITIQNSALPTEYALGQNYPNPFNPSTVIRYQLPVNGYVTLKVYDLLGQEIATLVEGTQEAGYKEIRWEASTIPSGVYFYRITSNMFSDVKKMVLMK